MTYNTSYKIVIEDLISYIKDERGLSEKTLEAYLYDIKDFLSFIGQQKITFQLIENFILSPNIYRLKNSTKRRKKISIICLCNHLASRNLLNDQIPELLHTIPIDRKINEVLDDNDIYKIIYAIRSRRPICRTTNILRDVAIVLVLYHSGIRITELCMMDICDVDFEKKYLFINGKNNKERIVPTTQKCIDAMNEYITTDRSAKCDAVFVKKDGKRITRRCITDMLTNVSNKVGLGGVTSHTLRGSCATQLMNHGMDLEMIRILLGHKNLSTTQVYLSTDNIKLKNIHTKYHPLG